MKKFLAVLFTVVGLTLYGCAPAQAAPAPTAVTAPQHVSASVSAPKALPANFAGGGGAVQMANFTSCYTSMFGEYWCYRYGCTLYDLVVYNCYNGWVKINRPWYA